MSKPQLTISGYSTALFSTWYMVDELAIMFDCGDGVCAGLLQKSRKPRHVFISHADRDHVAGLFQFCQLNSRPELKIYYPRDCGTFPAIQDFLTKFDPHAVGAQWIPIEANEEVEIKKDHFVRAVVNRHVPTEPDQIKSLSFFVEQRRRKLRSELIGLAPTEIAQRRSELGEEGITKETRKSILAYSADTPIDVDGRWNEVETLIHESTFLTDDEIEIDNPRRNKHSSLDQVMEMVSMSNIQQLILGHFSSRYSDEEIDTAIDMNRNRFGVSIPIKRVLPGRRVVDILAETPRR